MIYLILLIFIPKKRIAFYLLNAPDEESQALIDAIMAF